MLARSLIFPCSCVLCDAPLSFYHNKDDLCRKCYQLLTEQVGLFQSNSGHHYLFHHQTYVKSLIKKAKSKPSFRTFQTLIRIATPHIFEIKNNNFDIIIPIPSKFTSLLQRQFAPAFEFATACSDALGIPISYRSLILRKNIKKQSRLSRAKRIKNTEDAFLAAAHVSSKHILLVDDVVTTGATMYAAQTELIKKGALSVSTISLSASVLHSRDHEKYPR